MLQEPVVSFEDRFNPLKCYIKWRRSSYYGIPYPNPPGPIGFGTNTRSDSLAFLCYLERKRLEKMQQARKKSH